MGALPRVCKSFNFGENVMPRQSQPLRLGGTVMASQNSVLGQESLISASALIRPGVVIVARTCKSKSVSTSRLLTSRKEGLSRGRRRCRKSSMGGKKRSANDALTRARASSYFLAQAT